MLGSSVGLTAWVSKTISQVWPSGADLATALAPIEPEPPARFSTMTVAPSRCCRPGWTRREIASTEPPGGNGATSLIGPAWAKAVRGDSSAAPSPRTSSRRRNPLSIMMMLPLAGPGGLAAALSSWFVSDAKLGPPRRIDQPLPQDDRRRAGSAAGGGSSGPGGAAVRAQFITVASSW